MSKIDLMKQNVKLRGKIIRKIESKDKKNTFCYLIVEYFTQNPKYTNSAKFTIKANARELCYDAFEEGELVEVYYNIETSKNTEEDPGLVNLYAWRVINLI